MHVLIIPSEQFGAQDAPLAGMFQRDQARVLSLAGARVGVIAPKPRSLRQLRPTSMPKRASFLTDRDGEVSVHRFDDWVWIPERAPYAFGRVFRHVGQRLYDRYVEDCGAPDVLHAHNALYGGSLAVHLKRRTGLPVVLTEHSSAHLTGTMRGWQRRIARDVYRNVDVRIAVSPALCHALEAQDSPVSGNWRWIPNVLDPLFEDQAIRDTRARGTFQFLTVGSLKPVKNHAGLIRAFAEAFGDDRAVELRIVGAGPLRAELEALVASLGVAQQVRFLGYLGREDVLTEMQTCDAFVLPSTHETFGVVLIEALACGRPVIATACGGPEDIVGEEDGILVPAQKLDALRGALGCMRETSDRYSPADIRSRCLRRFGRSIVAKQLLAVYRVLLENE